MTRIYKFSLRRWSVFSLLLYCALYMPSSAQTCPPDQYPYTCSACLRFLTTNNTFSEAAQLCIGVGGQLASVEDRTQLQILRLYSEGLGHGAEGVWVGYRFTSSRSVVDEDGRTASDAVVESLRRSVASTNGGRGGGGGGGGGAGDCVMLKGGELDAAPCSSELAHACLIHYKAPSAPFTSPPTGPLYIAPNDPLILRADISSLGTTHTEWRINGTQLTPSFTTERRTRINETYVELREEVFSPELHGGIYELLAANPAGVAVVATWTVRRAELGHFAKFPADLTIPEESIAFFECVTSNSHPAPAITWYRGSQRIAPNSVHMYISNATNTLLVRDVGRADEGLYHCEVENVAGRMSSETARLTVRPPADFADAPQQFLLPPRNLSILEGGAYTVECVALHRQPMQLYILNASKVFVYPMDPGFPVWGLSNVSFAEHNSVSFVCLYGSQFGGGEVFRSSKKAVLTVHTPPRIRQLETTAGSSAGPHSIPASSGLALQCAYTGVPSPTQRWYINGKQIGTKDREEEEEEGVERISMQQVVEPSSGVYQCVVGSQYGEEIRSTEICVEALPGPTPFSVESDTTTSLYVTWDTPEPPNTPPLLLQYQVLTTHTLTNHTVTSGILPAHLRSFVARGLNASTRYEVKVQSHSPRGWGENGTAKRVYTFGPAPSIPPSHFLNITVSRTHDNTGLVVQWTPTLPPSPAILYTNYCVEYREVGGEGVGVVEVPHDQGWAFVGDLGEASGYEVRLRAEVQIQRAPPKFDYTPWTVWLKVQGVTTPPPATTLEDTTHTPSQGSADKSLNRDSLLLVVVLVPLLSVIILVLLLVVVIAGGWRYWSNRPTATYNPGELERKQQKQTKLTTKGTKGRQVPMGREIFTLPIPTESGVENEGTTRVTIIHPTLESSSLPSSHSGENTLDSHACRTYNAE